MLKEYNYIGDRVFQEQLKVILSNNNLTIKNFKELKSINDDYILVDNYLFTGTLLRITILDEGFLEIHGNIKEIKIID